jgi:hypothetical protein
MKRKLEACQTFVNNNEDDGGTSSTSNWDSEDSSDFYSSDSDDDGSSEGHTGNTVWRSGMGMTMVAKRVMASSAMAQLTRSSPNISELMTNALKQRARNHHKMTKSESSVFPTSFALSKAKAFDSCPAMNQPKKEKTSNLTNLTKKPVDSMMGYLEARGLTLDMLSSSDDSYMKISDQDFTAYPQVAQAARREDLAALQKLYAEGSPLQCTNNYGESVVHIVCRRASFPLLKFLMEDAKVSIRVRDDMGRTPLHDAAWTTEPNFELVNLLLAESPDLLLVKDKRGHLAVNYVPPASWAKWCDFLDANQHLVTAALESKNLIINK